MGKVIFKEVKVGIKRIINLGNYENVSYECEATVEVHEGPIMDDVDRHEAYETALAFCKEKVGAEVDRLTKK